jgi:citrate lyase beta subunit
MEIERAKRLLTAARGAARFEGELVDEASRKLAAALLRRAEVLG